MVTAICTPILNLGICENRNWNIQESLGFDMKKSVGLNYILNLSYQLLSILTPIITTPYVSRVLGVTNIGVYSFASSIVAYFVLFATLGTTIYGQREISYCQTDRERRSKSFWSIECISIITTIISLFVYLLFIGISTKNNSILFIILSLSIVNVAIDITWLYQGMEDFPTVVARNFLLRILTVICIFIFVQTEADLLIYVVINVGLTLFGSFYLWIGLGKYVTKIDIKEVSVKEHLPGLLLLFIPTIATTLYTQFDKTMLGMLTVTSVENGYYEQAMKISKTTLTIVTSLGAVMLPRIGSYYHDGNKDLIIQTLYKSFRFVTLLGCPLSLMLIAVSANFVPWFFGSGYAGVIDVLRILSVHNIIIAYSNVAGMQFLVPTGNQNKLTLSVFVGAAVNVILNYIFIPIWYAVGAALASVLSELIVTVIQMHFIFKILQVNVLFRTTWKYYFASVLMMSVILFENSFMISSLSNTCIMLVTGMLIYSLTLLIIKDSLFKERLEQVLRRFRRYA